ncbi:MAG TPA: glycogen synthase [Spirochaetia bacterium]|nr:glycogen synthase [Spirochaetia bacterium]
MPQKKQRTILMVTSEVFPFVKSGGLADVTGSLSRVLSSRGNDVRIVMPLYGSMSIKGFTVAVSALKVQTGFGEEGCSVLETTLPESEIPVYLIKHDSFFTKREGLYGSKEEPFFADNAKRFGFFCRSAVALLEALRLSVDVVHAHDWQAALSPVYIQADWTAERGKRPASVLTIHNIAYQGEFSPHSIHYLGLSPSWFRETRNTAGDTVGDTSLRCINFLRTGILHADMITTVSPTYAEEIRTQALGAGLDSLLSQRAKDLKGVLNGIDYEVWNPETDPALPSPFSEKDLGGKAEAKRELRRRIGLKPAELKGREDDTETELPLIGMVTRLAEQKGFPELLTGEQAALPRLLSRRNAEFVILGTGNPDYERRLKELASSYENLKVIIGFSEEMAHLIEGASDFFLMPSRYEPCGLNQMYSLRYGTLPIVHRTGGLKDTVEPYDPLTGGGTGFLFDRMDPDEIVNTVTGAIMVYREKPEHIRRMRIRAMEKRFSWDSSAEQYEAIYDEAANRKRIPQS